MAGSAAKVRLSSGRSTGCVMVPVPTHAAPSANNSFSAGHSWGPHPQPQPGGQVLECPQMGSKRARAGGHVSFVPSHSAQISRLFQPPGGVPGTQPLLPNSMDPTRQQGKGPGGASHSSQGVCPVRPRHLTFHVLSCAGHPNMGGSMQRMNPPRGMGPMGPGPQVTTCLSVHLPDHLCAPAYSSFHGLLAFPCHSPRRGPQLPSLHTARSSLLWQAAGQVEGPSGRQGEPDSQVGGSSHGQGLRNLEGGGSGTQAMVWILQESQSPPVLGPELAQGPSDPRQDKGGALVQPATDSPFVCPWVNHLTSRGRWALIGLGSPPV